jgi:Ca2+-binding EF-hand superfamily protein
LLWRRAQLTVEELFDLIDLNKDGTLDRNEVVAAAKKLRMTPGEAGALFDELDADKVRS